MQTFLKDLKSIMFLVVFQFNTYRMYDWFIYAAMNNQNHMIIWCYIRKKILHISSTIQKHREITYAPPSVNLPKLPLICGTLVQT